tara:strand:- start:235 stop:633 length:399 start_codon:yes stop_codon:yes gene_type:complete
VLLLLSSGATLSTTDDGDDDLPPRPNPPCLFAGKFKSSSSRGGEDKEERKVEREEATESAHASLLAVFLSLCLSLSLSLSLTSCADLLFSFRVTEARAAPRPKRKFHHAGKKLTLAINNDSNNNDNIGERER